MNEYKKGDVVCIEQCWEDEAGHYHDETATIKKINDDGSLKLMWHVKKWRLKSWLNQFVFTVNEIAYLV